MVAALHRKMAAPVNAENSADSGAMTETGYGCNARRAVSTPRVDTQRKLSNARLVPSPKPRLTDSLPDAITAVSRLSAGSIDDAGLLWQ